VILSKYWNFFWVSIGCWEDRTYYSYDIEGKSEYSLSASWFERQAEKTSAIETIQQESAAAVDSAESVIRNRDARQDYLRIISSIVSTRSLCIQLAGGSYFTIYSLFSSIMSSTPLWVKSERLSHRLPSWFIKDVFLLSRTQEEDDSDNATIQEHLTDTEKKMWQELLREVGKKEVQTWIVATRGVHIFVTESRFFQYMLNLYRFVLMIGLTYSSPKAWMLSTLFIILPYAFVCSLHYIILLGKHLGVTDEDLCLSYCLKTKKTLPKDVERDMAVVISSQQKAEVERGDSKVVLTTSDVTSNEDDTCIAAAPNWFSSAIFTSIDFGGEILSTMGFGRGTKMPIQISGEVDNSNEKNAYERSFFPLDVEGEASFVGRRMKVYGFEEHAELNGCVGTCRKYDDKSGQFELFVEDVGVVKISGDNLLLDEQ